MFSRCQHPECGRTLVGSQKKWCSEACRGQCRGRRAAENRGRDGYSITPLDPGRLSRAQAAYVEAFMARLRSTPEGIDIALDILDGIAGVRRPR